MFGPAGVDGLRMLDLYAGTGGFGMAALRRGAGRVEFIERDGRSCEELKRIAAPAISEDRAKVHCGDALKVLERLSGSFDVIFADPPYADVPFKDIAEALEKRQLLAEGGTVFLEHFRKTDLPEKLAGLQRVTRREYGDAALSVYREGAAVQRA
jgi:16S rRNA (guanine(966)-N(2))-methyltransferase RsmD